MCYVALIPLVVGAITAGAQAYQQSDNQRRQINYQNRLTSATEKSAATAANADYVAMLERVSQERAAASMEAFEATRGFEQATAQLTVGAQHSGLEGGVVSDLRMAIATQAGQDVAIRARNAQWQEAQIMRSLSKVSAEHQSRINSRMPQGVPGIDYAGLLGQLGQTAIQAYGMQSSSRSAT